MIKETRIRPIARRALATQSDDRLVRLFREGHDPAFEEIVSRYQAPLTAFAAAIVPHDRAQDVVQSSLVRAHKALRADDREISLRAWLFTIVRNGALNVIRDEPDWQELDPSYNSVPQPAEIAERNEELQALVTAICALPDDQREALVSRELRGDGHAEIASRLGTTATAVRGLIFRARTALRNGLGAAIPLPLLRLMLAEGATGAAGAGAVGLGGGAKLAATVSAGAIALGGGLALKPDGSGDRAPAKAEAAEAADGQSRGHATGPGPAAAGPRAAATAHAGRSGRVTSSDRAEGGSGEDRGDGESGREGEDRGGNSGRGGSDDGRGDGGRGGKGGGPGPDGGDDDHSGHGGGGHDDDYPGEAADDDHSGKSGSDSEDDRSGPEDDHSSEEKPDDDRSGKDGGDDLAAPGGEPPDD